MRKKILIGGAIILLAGVWLLWFVGGKTLEKRGGNALPEKIAQVDTDKDDLADWEEALWQTDKNKSDTDGDGTSDGEEIAASRDPKKAGPDDAITNPADRINVLARNAVMGSDMPPLTLPAETIASRQSNPLGQLIIIDPESADTPTLYGHNFAEAIRPYLETQTENLSGTLLRYVDFGNPNDLTLLRKAATGARQAVENLRAVAVPKSIAETHQKFVEHLAKVSQLLTAMADVQTQPLLAAQSSQQYMLKYLYVTKPLLYINQYFIDHQVKFDASTTPKIIFTFQ